MLFHPLTLVTFFPLVGVLVLLFLKPEQKNAVRWVALITSLVTFGISIVVLAAVQAWPTRPADGDQPALDPVGGLEDQLTTWVWTA